jgi:uncharacterized membrane protein
MNPIQEKKTIDELFRWSLGIKAVAGLFEIGSGVATLFLTTNRLLRMMRLVVGGTLANDPDNFIANYILNVASRYTPGQTNLFLFAYIAGHGIVNLFLVVCLLKKKTWAYPLSIVIFSLFVIFSAWQVYFSHSALLALFTMFDCIVIVLIAAEMSRVRRRRVK